AGAAEDDVAAAPGRDAVVAADRRGDRLDEAKRDRVAVERRGEIGETERLGRNDVAVVAKDNVVVPLSGVGGIAARAAADEGGVGARRDDVGAADGHVGRADIALHAVDVGQVAVGAVVDEAEVAEDDVAAVAGVDRVAGIAAEDAVRRLAAEDLVGGAV